MSQRSNCLPAIICRSQNQNKSKFLFLLIRIFIVFGLSNTAWAQWGSDGNTCTPQHNFNFQSVAIDPFITIDPYNGAIGDFLGGGWSQTTMDHARYYGCIGLPLGRLMNIPENEMISIMADKPPDVYAVPNNLTVMDGGKEYAVFTTSLLEPIGVGFIMEWTFPGCNSFSPDHTWNISLETASIYFWQGWVQFKCCAGGSLYNKTA